MTRAITFGCLVTNTRLPCPKKAIIPKTIPRIDKRPSPPQIMKLRSIYWHSLYVDYEYLITRQSFPLFYLPSFVLFLKAIALISIALWFTASGTCEDRSLISIAVTSKTTQSLSAWKICLTLHKIVFGQDFQQPHNPHPSHSDHSKGCKMSLLLYAPHRSSLNSQGRSWISYRS